MTDQTQTWNDEYWERLQQKVTAHRTEMAQLAVIDKPAEPIDIDLWELYPTSDEQAGLPRTKEERHRAAWTKAKAGLSGREQWLLELLQHGRTDRIEELIASVEAGKEQLAPPTNSFVQWRSRGILDPDIATAGGEAILRELAEIQWQAQFADTQPLSIEQSVSQNPNRHEAMLETNQFPRLDKLMRP